MSTPVKDHKSRIDELEKKVENLENAVIKLRNNDEMSRNGVSKLQNLVLGLFKKLLSSVTSQPEEKVNLIKWAKLKKIMCNNPNHLSEFSIKSNIKYCGTDPTCPECRYLGNSTKLDFTKIDLNGEEQEEDEEEDAF